MKYIKKYEAKIVKKYTLQDFKDIKYWRYKHDMINCIMKIIDNDIMMLHLGEILHPDLLFTHYKNLEEKNFIGILNSRNFILRPATKKEISEFETIYKKFETEKIAQKYNL